MFGPEDIHIKNGIADIDFTLFDPKQRIPAKLWPQVLLSAELLQEESDIMFEPEDVIFHPGTGKLYEVEKVIDNRHRTPYLCYMLQCRHGQEQHLLPATAVLHFWYLLEAYSPYDAKLTTVMGDNIESILPHLIP